jgi:hypothetical protein
MTKYRITYCQEYIITEEVEADDEFDAKQLIFSERGTVVSKEPGIIIDKQEDDWLIEEME